MKKNMAQKRKIDEDKENALTDLAKKSKTSKTNENEEDSNHPTTSATPESNIEENLENPQILATITNTVDQMTANDEAKEAQAEIDREKELSDTFLP